MAVKGSRALGRHEEAVEQRAGLGGIHRVGAAAVRRRARRRFEERAVDRRAALGEARAVEETLLVQPVGDLGDPVARHELTARAHDRGLNVGDRVLAVEERHDLQEPTRQQHDRAGVPGRVAERDHLPALVLDGKRLDLPQAWGDVAHRWRKLRAAAA